MGRARWCLVVSIVAAWVWSMAAGVGAASSSPPRLAGGARVGAVPAVPFLASASADGLSVLAAWAPNDATDAVTGYALRATPLVGARTAACPVPAATTFFSGPENSGMWLAGLCAQVPYQVTMTATNAAGTSAVSPPSLGVVPLPAAAPKAPQIVQVLGRSASLRVAWSGATFDGGRPVTGYVVSVRKGATLIKSVTAPATALAATVPGLVNGTVYAVTVAAKNAVGSSPTSTGSGKPVPVYPPTPPTGLTALPDGAGRIVVSWAAPVDDGGGVVTGYTVTYQQVDRDGVPVPGAPVHTLPVAGTVTSVTASVFEEAQALYAFTATATNTVGASKAATLAAPMAPITQVKSETVILTDATLSAIGSVSGTGVDWFAPAPAQAEALTVGSVIVGGVSGGTPYGLLRKVTAVTSDATGLHLATTEAAVGDVFTNMTLATLLNPAASTTPGARAGERGVVFRPASPGVKIDTRAAGAILGGQVSIDFDTKDRDGSFVSAKFAVKAETKLSIDVHTSWGVPDGTAVDASSVVTATMSAQVGLRGNKEWKIGEITSPPATVMVGPVPVLLQSRVPIYLTAGGQVAVGASASMAIGGSLYWDSTDPSRLSVSNLSTKPVLSGGAIPGLTLTGQGRVGLKAAVIVEVYRFAGLQMSVTNDLVVDVDFRPAAGKPFLSISDEVEVKAGFAADRFGTRRDLVVEVYSNSWANLVKLAAPPKQAYAVTALTAATPGTPISVTATRTDGAAATKTWKVVGGVTGDAITGTGRFTAANPADRLVTITVSDAAGASGRLDLTVGKPFDPPLNLTLAKVVSGSDLGMIATWSPPGATGASPVDHYQVTTSPATPMQTIPAGTTRTTWTGLAAGRYVATVYAVNTTGAISAPATAAVDVDTTTSISTFTQVSAGAYHSCAVTAAGAAKCWGDNSLGELGDGTTTNRLTPVTVSGLSSGVTSITAGSMHSCAVTTTGAAKCWGANPYGQLGDGTTIDRFKPVSVSGLTAGIISISAGWGYGCAVTSTGSAKCWGENSFGQLGDGTRTDRWKPVAVTGLMSGVSSISAGSSDSCAVTAGGAAKCWGDNSYGQLGDGTRTGRLTPVNVAGLSGVTAVSTGSMHTCAATNTAVAKCWGDNAYGQLGDGTTVSRLTPVTVSGASSLFASINAGWGYSCAVTTVGAARCWGRNASGQLGDGTTIDRSAPVGVWGLSSGVTSLRTGAGYFAFSCATSATGGAKCWGDNSWGQLGDGTTTARLTPVEVTG